MKIIERDKYEGESFFLGGLDGDDSADLVTGKLMKDNGEQHGWYSIKRTPNSEQLIDYTDPITFETSKQMCAEFICRRMRMEDTGWAMMEAWMKVVED
jgi:hypothetical protein